MGVSTNAIVFYGYCWDDVFIPWVGNAAFLCNGFGPPEGTRYEDKRLIENAFAAANRKEIDSFYVALQSIGKEFGCEISSHCSDNCSMPYIAIESAGKTASRGYPQKINSADLVVNPQWNAMLEKFCEEIGITPPDGQKPQWWLVSYWG